ncbi:MAG: hypothetical protein EU530_08990 [Promethearchaeota archaeon]|nr:MAG: hypothetical protein EU530_08990 [Candidatus Lokiarchaeota archaeon]
MGLLTILSRIIVASGLGIYIYGMLILIFRNSRSKKHPESERFKEHPGNLSLLLLCLVFLLLMSQIKLTFEYNGTLEMNVNILVVSIFIGLGITFLISHFVLKKKSDSSDIIQHVLSSKEPEDFKKYTLLLDIERKSNHLIAFLLALFSISVGWITVFILVRYFPSHPEYAYILEKSENFWNRADGTTFLQNLFNTEIFSTSRTILSITFGGFSLFLLTIEYARLSKKIYFPFQEIVQKQLRWEEKNAIGSYIYLMMGLAVSSLLLPSMMFLGVASVVSFGDSAASLLGIKFGKKKYPHNNKTVEGTLIGSFLTLFTVFLFAGIYFAVAAVVVFILIDLICPNPLKMNDNLLLPLVLTGVFIILFVLKVPSPNIVEYFI